MIGGAVIVIMLIACLGTLPYTLGREAGGGGGGSVGPRRFEATHPERAMLPPVWAAHAADEQARLTAIAAAGAAGVSGGPPRSWLGTDRLGRSMLVRSLAGGGISLSVGLAAAVIAVLIGTMYGTVAGWSGGRTDAILMRIVDVLYGLPYILLVVLLAVAVDGLAQGRAAGDGKSASWWAMMLEHIDRRALNVMTLLVAIGGVSWLTMARVIRGQVLTLKQQPFMEACRAIGVPLRRQFLRHLLPNLLGPIIVYATLTVPAAILSESFLSFLGIGVQEPLPSWGNLAASGLSELNTVRPRWWLLFWPCLFIAVTLLALNFVGEALRERFDPKRR